MVRRLNSFIFIFATSLSVGAALAHSGATGVVKERMDAMKDVAANMKIIGQMVKGETAIDAKAVSNSASIIARHGKELTSLYPEGSNQKPSEALDIIWTDWAGFEQSAKEMEEAAEKLANASKTELEMRQLRAMFSEIGRTCSTCHEKFRLKN